MGHDRKDRSIVSEVQSWTKGPHQQLLLLGLSLTAVSNMPALTAAPNVRVFIEPTQWTPLPMIVTTPESALAALYAPFIEEDRRLAVAGLSDFARMLEAEDSLE